MIDTSNQVLNWLKVENYGVVVANPDDSEYMKKNPQIEKLAIAFVPNTDLRFLVMFDKTSRDCFENMTSRNFGKKEKKVFDKLSSNEKIRFYRGIEKIAFTFGVNVISFPKENRIIFIRTFFIEKLNRQYFLTLYWTFYML